MQAIKKVISSKLFWAAFTVSVAVCAVGLAYANRPVLTFGEAGNDIRAQGWPFTFRWVCLCDKCADVREGAPPQWGRIYIGKLLADACIAVAVTVGASVPLAWIANAILGGAMPTPGRPLSEIGRATKGNRPSGSIG